MLFQVQNLTRRRNETLTKSNGTKSFLESPPRNMHYLREAILQEIKLVAKALSALEREYYGDKANINGEVRHSFVFTVQSLNTDFFFYTFSKFHSSSV